MLDQSVDDTVGQIRRHGSGGRAVPRAFYVETEDSKTASAEVSTGGRLHLIMGSSFEAGVRDTAARLSVKRYSA
jgi:hypothetical protein